jgi:hypothetical protein
VTLKIYNASNVLVRTLVNGAARSAGANNELWDLKNDAAVPAAVASPNLPANAAVSLATAVVVLGFGIIPSPLIDLARTASSSLFG